MAAPPRARLVQGSDGDFYGTTFQGGASNYGTVFKITPAGVLTTLHSFNKTNGSYPVSELVQGIDGDFYGTTSAGGDNVFYGTVFKITPAGVLTTLHSFNLTNGSGPGGGLVQGSDGDFYGTTFQGGASNYGTVFKITPAGTLTTLHCFNEVDGLNPSAGAVFGTDGKLYGVAASMTVWRMDLTFPAPPTVTASVTSLTSNSTTMTITGTGFDTTPGNNTVVFTPAGTGTVTSSTETSMTVTGLTGLMIGALNAVVTTNGNSSCAAVQVATVINSAPTDLALNSSSIAENVADNSTVGTLSTTDPDIGDTFTYTLVSGTGSTDNAAFHIAGSSLQINASPDFETKTIYAVRVRTTDAEGLAFERPLTVTIINIPEPIITISGKAQPIAPGSSVPSTADDTDYGNVALLNTQVTHTFTISNSGEAALTLSGTPNVALSGPAAMDFKVTALPDAAVAAGGTTTFAITFDPSQPGVRTATVTVASDDGLNGSYSFAISGFGGLAKLLAQTISFTPPTTVYMGQGPLALVATSNSGLPVTLSVVSGPASLTGNALTLSAPGAVKVLATQAGAGNYAPARSVLRTLAGKDVPTTLTLINLSQSYDGQPKAPSTIPAGATMTYKQGTTVVAAPTNAGSYTVTAVLGATTKTGTLVIAKAPLYVTPDDQRKFAGQANPTPLGFTYSGFQGTDTDSVITKAPALKTTATTASAGGLYPITASGATALNYSFIYRQGTLVVESFAGTYEALLVDGTALPAGKVSIVVTNTSKTFTGKIYAATESTALPVSGTLTTNGDETATGAFSGTRLTIPYTLSFTLPLYGDVTVTTTRNGMDIGSATNGHKLLALPRGKTVLYGGAHTAVLEPVMPTASDVPIGAGWAKATIRTTGVMTLSGRLGDGTAFTQTLTPDVDSNPGYRLFVQPYKTGKVTRTQSYLGGAFTLMPHPSLTNRRYIGAANLSWQKTGLSTDTAYRAGFGPVTTVLILDPWLAPKGTDTLAVRLGLSAAGFSVAHSATDSAANANLPTQVGLSVKNVVNVLAPVTIPVNSTKWYTKPSTTTGTFTGGFELQDGVQKRKVTFSGVLRQPAAALETVIGDGHYVQPALTGAPTTEQHTGEVLFTRP
jgi:uncharacterized repeat protein (TIGR03803 family)